MKETENFYLMNFFSSFACFALFCQEIKRRKLEKKVPFGVLNSPRVNLDKYFRGHKKPEFEYSYPTEEIKEAGRVRGIRFFNAALFIKEGPVILLLFPPLPRFSRSTTSAVLRLSDHGHRSRLRRICIRLKCGRDPTQRTSRRRDYLSPRVGRRAGANGGDGAGVAKHLGCLSKSPQRARLHTSPLQTDLSGGPFTRRESEGLEWSPAYAIRLWTSQKERSLKIWISRSFRPYLGIKEVIYWELWRIARPPGPFRALE